MARCSVRTGSAPKAEGCLGVSPERESEMRPITVMLLIGVVIGLAFQPLKLVAVGCALVLAIQNPLLTVLLLLGLYKIRS